MNGFVRTLRMLLVVGCVLVVIGVAVFSVEGQKKTDGAKKPPTTTSCNAPLGWWESAGLQPLFLNPQGAAPTTDCDFHVWSWTAFVHWTLIDPDTGNPKFMSLQTPADFNSGTSIAPGQRVLVLLPRDSKEEHATGIDQAGPGGIIVDQDCRVVYYSTHVDPIYFNFADQYYGVANYNNAPATVNFPIGATVFKASWRIVQPNENTDDVFTTKATIAKLVNDASGKAVASGETIPDVTVALVGLHVVGVIKDHPEFAWATFEHNSNAPNLPPGMSPQSTQSVSNDDFTFYKAGTAAEDCNSEVDGLPIKVSITDVDTQAAAPVTNVFRQFQFGGAAPDRAADIASANNNFQSAIIANSMSIKDLDPVFANYFLVGTVWQNANSLEPNDGSMDESSIGSTSLMNATLETYVQGSGRNCFMCHNTAGYTPKGSTQPLYPGKNINLSHIILSPFFTE